MLHWKVPRQTDDGRAAVAAGDPRAAVDRLRAALDLWRGPACHARTGGNPLFVTLARVALWRHVGARVRMAAPLRP